MHKDPYLDENGVMKNLLGITEEKEKKAKEVELARFCKFFFHKMLRKNLMVSIMKREVREVQEYYLMSRDKMIARVKGDVFLPKHKDKLPFYLQRTGDFVGWLESRAIDKHRTNSRLLKKALRLTTAADSEIVIKNNAVSITDTYWVKGKDSELTYEDVRFKTNLFDKLALYGDPDSFNLEGGRTPELTNIGSFEKCWRIIDEEWYLYKAGSELELFSELFICNLGKILGFNMAEYEMDGEYIRSKDFTNGASVNFEAMWGLLGDDEDYEKNYNALPRNCREDYVKMIFLDTLCFNMDRHTKNYGILRDFESGDILKFAPNFDNNVALVSRGYPKNVEMKNDKLIELWSEFNNGKNYHFEVYDENVRDAMRMTPIDVDEKFILAFIMNRYAVL